MRARHPVAVAATLAVAAAASAGLAGTPLTTLISGRGSAESPASAGTQATASEITVQVTDVVDGDTVRVQTREGRDLGRVRLFGIDAPENRPRRRAG